MKYNSLKEYIVAEHLKDLTNQVKIFLKKESDVYILDENIQKIQIISIYCKSKPTDKIKIAINMMIKVLDKPRRYLTLYTDINFKEITIENTETEKNKADLLHEKMLYDEFAIPKMTDQDMEEWAEDFWKNSCKNAIYEKYIFPYQYILPNLGMQIEDGKLPDNIMGRIYYKEGEVECVHKNPMLKVIGGKTIQKSIVQPGTVILNTDSYFMEDIGGYILTITHEIVHWMLHRNFFEIFYLIQRTCEMNCDSEPKKYTKDGTDIEKALWAVEKQANELGMRLAMPRSLFLELLEKEYNNRGIITKWSCRAEAMETAISKVAKLFGVSELAAKTRAIQLGVKEADGTYINVDGQYHRPFFFKRAGIDQNQTFLIDKKELKKIYNQERYVRKLLDSKEYIYLGDVVCCNNRKYIKKIDNEDCNVSGIEYELTAYGRDHVDECCLVFEWESIFVMDGNSDFYGQCYLSKDISADEYIEKKYSLRRGLSKSKEELTKEFDKIKDAALEMKKHFVELSKCDFAGTIQYHLNRKKMKWKTLSERTEISTKTLSAYHKNKVMDIPVRNLVAICIGLNLLPAYSYDLLSKAGRILRDDNEEDRIYKILIDYYTDVSIYDCNDVIDAWNERKGAKKKARHLPDDRNQKSEK